MTFKGPVDTRGRLLFALSRSTCEKRIADAKTIGWKALEQSWQRDLDRIEALERAPGPLVGVLHKPNTGKD